MSDEQKKRSARTSQTGITFWIRRIAMSEDNERARFGDIRPTNEHREIAKFLLAVVSFQEERILALEGIKPLVPLDVPGECHKCGRQYCDHPRD